jgi:hypothetical protein
MRRLNDAVAASVPVRFRVYFLQIPHRHTRLVPIDLQNRWKQASLSTPEIGPVFRQPESRQPVGQFSPPGTAGLSASHLGFRMALSFARFKPDHSEGTGSAQTNPKR